MLPDASKPTPEDRQRVLHMLRCCTDAEAIAARIPHNDVLLDMALARALTNCFAELGEAANRLSTAGRSHVGEAPWRRMVGLRNIVIHVYWTIDLPTLIQTARDDLPTLRQQLDAALQNWPA